MALLTAASLEKIRRELGKYPADQKQSAVMSALGIAQDQHGWLPNELMEEVAKALGMPPVAVFEVATFYNMYNLQPPGKHKLVMCTNLPCALSGAVEAAEHLKRRCGVEDFNQTSGDGRFTVKEGECFGACGDAPVMIVDNKRMCSRMTAGEIDRLLEELG
ncbi:MAG TPA: NADH-quinone oxidoreductase subunit NuoE [Usitatibacter sp.]|jgi:NADH-quinone oxidoreductase subunit E|nr:NADH-quinone oxidoreductase subunit NuoE [Usitatibacter sp.]